MIRWREIGLLTLGALIVVGCKGVGTPSTTAKLQPSTFFDYCTNDLISAEFDDNYAVEDPGNGVKNDPTKLRVEHSYIYSSTAEECNRMMRKLYAKLHILARDAQCRLSNEDAKGTKTGVFNDFSFDYTVDDRSGTVLVEVVVLEPATAKGKPMRYRVELSVTERLTKEEMPAPK